MVQLVCQFLFHRDRELRDVCSPSLSPARLDVFTHGATWCSGNQQDKVRSHVQIVWIKSR